MKTIFEEVKDALDVHEEDTAFDTELTLLLSSAMSILSQLGVHETADVRFTRDLTWDAYEASAHDGDFDMVKTYILLKVRLGFDPPTASTLAYIKEAVKELEWRIKESYTGDYVYEEHK